MKRLVIILAGVLVLGVFGFLFWPKPAGPLGPSTMLEAIQHLARKRDTALLARIERARDSLALDIQRVDSMFKYRNRAMADSLHRANQQLAAATAARQALRSQVRTLEEQLAGAEEDDDSVPLLVALVHAQRNDIVAVSAERDAAFVLIRTLVADTLRLHEQLVQYQGWLDQAITQRDEYRKWGKRDWLTTGLTIALTAGACTMIAGESRPC